MPRPGELVGFVRFGAERLHDSMTCERFGAEV